MTPSTEQVQKAATSVLDLYHELSTIAHQQMEAAAKSVSAATKGVDEITRSTSGIVQGQLTRAASFGKTIIAARNIRDITDIQQELVKDMFDNWISHTSKLSEISTRVTQDVFSPFAEQTNSVISFVSRKMKKAA